MWIRRIIWIIMLFFSVVFYIFNNSPATLTVPICLLVLPVISFTLLKSSAGKAQVFIEFPENAKKNEIIPGAVKIINKAFIPVGNVDIFMETSNIRTGDKAEFVLESGRAGKKENLILFEIETYHCGNIKIAAKKIRLRDFLGLFSSERDISCKTTATVFPDRFDVSVSLSNSASALLEGDKYSRTKTGNDSSETMGIKEYIPGDPIKNMHWKLSAKTDKLLVKEFGQPIVDQVCLLLDMTRSADSEASDTDAVAEVFASITDAMVENEINPDIGWQDPENGVLNLRQIRSEEDLGAALREMMAVPVTENGYSISDAIAMCNERLGFAHVIAVGVSPILDMAHISNGARTTLILPDSRTFSCGLQKDGTSIIAFNKTRFREELAQVEI